MTKPKKSKRFIPQRKVVVRNAFIIASVLLLFFVGSWLTRNQSLYAPNKEKIHEEIISAINSIDRPSKPIYSRIIDEGCDSRNSVGLALYIHCDFVAYKYFKGDKDLSEDLKIVDKQLADAEWRRHLSKSQTIDKIDNILDARDDNQIKYFKVGVSSKIRLGFYKSKSMNDYRIKKLIDNGKIARPTPKEYIYGISVSVEYWSCRNDSFLIQPCPNPPTQPR